MTAQVSAHYRPRWLVNPLPKLTFLLTIGNKMKNFFFFFVSKNREIYKKIEIFFLLLSKNNK